MMELILSLTLIWALSSTAGALQCQTCTDLQCSSTASLSCTSETMCFKASLQGTVSGAPVQQSLKACAPSILCPTTNPQTYSANFGTSSAVASVQCCNTDNCNSGTVAAPAAQSDNSLQCFSCINSQCNTTVQCKGVEDRCFQMNVTTGSTAVPIYGCASTNLCTAAASLADLPFLQVLGNITSGPSCCETSLCNTVTATTAALIHLLLGLFIFTLF